MAPGPLAEKQWCSYYRQQLSSFDWGEFDKCWSSYWGLNCRLWSWRCTNVPLDWITLVCGGLRSVWLWSCRFTWVISTAVQTRLLSDPGVGLKCRSEARVRFWNSICWTQEMFDEAPLTFRSMKTPHVMCVCLWMCDIIMMSERPAVVVSWCQVWLYGVGLLYKSCYELF